MEMMGLTNWLRCQIPLTTTNQQLLDDVNNLTDSGVAKREIMVPFWCWKLYLCSTLNIRPPTMNILLLCWALENITQQNTTHLTVPHLQLIFRFVCLHDCYANTHQSILALLSTTPQLSRFFSFENAY